MISPSYPNSCKGAFFWVAALLLALPVYAEDSGKVFLEQGDVRGFRELVQAQPAEKAAVIACAQYEVLRQLKPGALEQLLKTESGQRFLPVFLTEQTWLESWLLAGPWPGERSVALGTLAEIFLADQDVASTPLYRELAVATAIAFADESIRAGFRRFREDQANPVTPLNRYFLFKKSHQAGKLHKSFERLSAWGLRMVVGAHADNASLEWFQDNIQVPLDEYHRVLKFFTYKEINAFGDRMGSPLFHVPAGDVSLAESLYLEGGVCGGLSNFGALNVAAHGIPSTPIGQPGHCAFGYRVGAGKWFGGNGLAAGWALHSFWKHSTNYLFLADEVFSDREAYLASSRALWRAHWALDNGDGVAARSFFKEALERQPLHWEVWKEYILFQLQSAEFSSADWDALTAQLQEVFATRYEPLVDLLGLYLDEKVLTGKSWEETEAIFLKLHAVLARISTPWRTWSLTEEVFKPQLQYVPEGAQDGFFKKVLAVHLNGESKGAFAKDLLDWKLKQIRRQAQAQDTLLEDVLALTTETKPFQNDFGREFAVTGLLLARERQNFEAFARFSEIGRHYRTGPQEKLSAPRPSKGRLISEDALNYVPALSNRHHWVLSQRDVLSEKGGWFECQVSVRQPGWMQVQLRKPEVVTGWVIAGPEAKEGSYALQVFASDDGRTWRVIGETKDFRGQWTGEVSEPIIAQWLKLEAKPNGVSPEAMQLQHFCIYGDKEGNEF